MDEASRLEERSKRACVASYAGVWALPCTCHTRRSTTSTRLQRQPVAAAPVVAPDWIRKASEQVNATGDWAILWAYTSPEYVHSSGGLNTTAALLQHWDPLGSTIRRSTSPATSRAIDKVVRATLPRGTLSRNRFADLIRRATGVPVSRQSSHASASESSWKAFRSRPSTARRVLHLRFACAQQYKHT